MNVLLTFLIIIISLVLLKTKNPVPSPIGYFCLSYACSALGCSMCSRGWGAQSSRRLNPVEVAATKVLQRKAWMTAVRVGAWNGDKNGIMLAWRLWKTKKLHCSGSWAGLPSLHLLSGWERRKLRGAGAECSGTQEGAALLSCACPVVPCVWGRLSLKHWSMGTFLWNVAMPCGESYKTSGFDLSAFSCRKCSVKTWMAEKKLKKSHREFEMVDRVQRWQSYYWSRVIHPF